MENQDHVPPLKDDPQAMEQERQARKTFVAWAIDQVCQNILERSQHHVKTGRPTRLETPEGQEGE